MQFDELFFDQLNRYPYLTAQDLVKALYQSIFGCGHFVDEAGRDYLARELASCAPAAQEISPVEPIGAGYCRVHLSAIGSLGLSPETLFRMFALSSRENSGSMDEMHAGLDRLSQLVAEGKLPPDDGFIAAYRAAGCPATHHSEAFRAAYHPAYRVVSARMCQCLPLLCAIDGALRSGDPVRVAIEGGSASGKSSLGALLAEIYDCNLFHMDDFFLQPHQRTPERFAQPGGNVDYERFAEEVLAPLRANIPFKYRVFDCSEMALGDTITVEPKQLSIVEGAYSMHPHLRDAYHISAFMDIDPDAQRARILRRNGEKMLRRFENEWIPLEHVYFEKTGARDACKIILNKRS